jgi:dTMP kinase
MSSPSASPMLSTAVSDNPLFESIEGLRGTGKSTVAPLLAAARGAVLVATVPPIYQPLRREIDKRANADARMCFYLSALFTATDEIRWHLLAGTPVVVESYFERCLATHAVVGACIGIALPPELPRPTVYQLFCEEDERKRRLAARAKPVSHWDALEERAPDRMVSAYSRFPMVRINTSLLKPEQVVDSILALTPQGAR